MTAKPTVDMPISEAVNELTGFEVLAVEKEFGTQLEHLGGLRTLLGAVWAFENRTAATSWANVKARTLSELARYFADKSPDPESEQSNFSNGVRPTPDT